MKLEDQVLTKTQVYELINLGFDVGKYASMCIKKDDKTLWQGKANNYYLPKYKENYMIDTLTIGDIIDILPKEISFVNKDIPLKLQTDMKSYLRYSSVSNIISIKQTETFIDMLFESLKWCIKEKHIAL